mgnify:CR=1 FL=1
MRTVVDAMSPANSPFTNPLALQKAAETNGASLMTGMQHMMADLQSGQLTHTDPEAFKLGENIAKTRHPKILIGKLSPYPEAAVAAALDRLAAMVEEGDGDGIRGLLGELLPEANLESSPAVTAAAAVSRSDVRVAKIAVAQPRVVLAMRQEPRTDWSRRHALPAIRCAKANAHARSLRLGS